LLAQLLREAGAVVEDVQDALTALRRLDEFKPDVIVSDVGMPDIDGYSFIRQLRGRTDVQASVPCLALTALARPEDREQALAAGFNEHLPKPCDPGVLIGIVRSLVAGRAGACVPQAGSVDDAALAKGADGTGAHILLAEDNASISAMLQQILESEGYRVSVAESVVDAVARADETPVHLLLSDLRLRDGMGWDLLKTLRTRGDVPGIVMSGYSESTYVTRSKQAGFAEFLVKPVDADELLEVIRRVLSQSTPAGS
jgi:CheY-like chemotaxis protein